MAIGEGSWQCRPRPVAPRFWQKVEVGEPHECWPWKGVLNKDGYGNLSVNGKMRLSTHVSLELDGSPRPGNAHALHSCDNPGCVNPAHLRWGSHASNMADMASKRRSGDHSGERNGRAKLSPTDVAAIRSSDRKLRELAPLYGVAMSTIARARRGLNWNMENVSWK